MTIIRAAGGFEQRDDWRTDPAIIARIKRYVPLSVDLAACFESCVVEPYFNQEASFLVAKGSDVRALVGRGVAWCNPPFSLAFEFFEKIIHDGIPTLAIFKTNNLAVPQWQMVARNMTAMRLLPRRRGYVNPDTDRLETSPSFASALITFNTDCLTRKIPECDTIIGGVTVSYCGNDFL